jgi:hypothetical protein
MKRWLARFTDEEGETRVLAVARVGMGILAANEAWDATAKMAAEWGEPRFRWTLLPAALVAPPLVAAALLGLEWLAAALAIAGRWARPALAACAALESYRMACDRLGWHNYRYSVILFALLVSIAPSDRRLVLGRREPERGGAIGPLWAQRLAQLQVSIMYLASGASKLADPAWRGGRVITDGVRRFAGLAMERGAPAWAIAALERRDVATAIACSSMALELALALGLWTRRGRAPALWCAVCFHLTIQLTSSVASFSWLMLLALSLFARPELGGRRLRFDPARRGHRAAARALRALDWLARFTVEERPGERLTLIDGEGQERTGARALAAAARALPLAFPAWPPLALVARLRA